MLLLEIKFEFCSPPSWRKVFRHPREALDDEQEVRVSGRRKSFVKSLLGDLTRASLALKCDFHDRSSTWGRGGEGITMKMTRDGYQLWTEKKL